MTMEIIKTEDDDSKVIMQSTPQTIIFNSKDRLAQLNTQIENTTKALDALKEQKAEIEEIIAPK